MCLQNRAGTLEAMDHVFKDTASEGEEARRQAIENDLIAQAHHAQAS